MQYLNFTTGGSTGL